jgi:hypothetical protein
LSRSEVGIQSFIQTVQTPICSTGHLVYLLLSSYLSQYNNAPIFMPHGTHSFLHIVRCRTGEARSIQLGLEAEDGRKISVAPSEGRVSFQGPRQNQTEQKPGGGPNSSRPPSRFLFLLCARSLMQLVFAEPRCPCSILPSSDWCAYEDEIIVTLNSRALEFFSWGRSCPRRKVLGEHTCTSAHPSGSFHGPDTSYRHNSNLCRYQRH